MNEPRIEVLAARVPREQAERLRALAHERGTSLSDLIRAALELIVPSPSPASGPAAPRARHREVASL